MRMQDISIDQNELLDHLAGAIIDRRLVTPAIFALELLKPFSLLSSQVLLLLEPMLQPSGQEQTRRYAMMLQDRTTVEYLLQKLEQQWEQARS